MRAYLYFLYFRTIKQELLHMDKVIQTLNPNAVAQNKEAQSKLEAIRRQQDNKVVH